MKNSHHRLSDGRFVMSPECEQRSYQCRAAAFSAAAHKQQAASFCIPSPFGMVPFILFIYLHVIMNSLSKNPENYHDIFNC